MDYSSKKERLNNRFRPLYRKNIKIRYDEALKNDKYSQARDFS